VNKSIKFYRYEVREIFHGETLPSLFGYIEHKLELLIFEIYKETPKGYWIRQGRGYSQHWVSKRKANKKYARDTKKRALECYIIRTNKRIKYLTRGLEKAEQGLRQAAGLHNENKI
jgi:hypothetical protein